jgi:type II secretory pathway component GspD/PulD (secretin)
MKTKLKKFARALSTFLAVINIPVAVVAADNSATIAQDAVPLIVIDNVPLADAIKNLARQANLNFILDPGLTSKLNVSVRWTNMSAYAALTELLKTHKLTIVTNAATSVARIAATDRGIKPVPASQVGTNAGTVIPLMVLDFISLSEAIQRLADAAQLTVVLDPKLKSLRGFNPEETVSFRWEKLTARQALAALLDNYDLMLIEEPASSSARITSRMQAGTPDGPKKQP